MFGWLIKSEVNDDAVRLKTLADQAVSKYLPLSRGELEAALKRDFPGETSYIDRSYASFVFPNAPEFHFTIEPPLHGYDDTNGGVVVQGTGKYAGFLLCASENHWHCSVEDGASYRATGGAKKLVKVMGEKFAVSDLKELWGLR